MANRRLKVLTLDPQRLVEIANRYTANNVPPDLEIVRGQMAIGTSGQLIIQLIIRSDAFDPIPELEQLPVATFWFRDKEVGGQNSDAVG